MCPYPTSGPVTGDGPLSDAKALVWIRGQLLGSGLFESVRLGRLINPVGNGSFPLAWVYPVGFQETDDVDPYQLTRTLRYAVGLCVKQEDPTDELTPMLEMDALSNQVANLLSSYGPEGYLPGLSRIEGGRYDPLPGSLSDPLHAAGVPQAGSAWGGLTLLGSIAYLVSNRGGRSWED